MNTRIRKLIHPLLSRAALKSQPFQVIQENEPIAEPNKPVIYAVNHSAFPDGPVMSAVVPKWALLLAGRQSLDFSGKLFFLLNGTLWVDRQDKADMRRAKDQIIQRLRGGNDLIWFPEATWNVTESQLMLPMRWGIIDAARKANAQIIPTVLHYDRERMEVHIRWGPAMDGKQLVDKATGIRDLRDTLATMRWEFWERNGTVSRQELNIASCRSELKAIIDEYLPLNADNEQAVIFRPYPLQETVFAAINKIQPNIENAFLFRKDIHN